MSIQRAELSDTEIEARALIAGWSWHENDPTVWCASKESPATGWLTGPDPKSSFYSCLSCGKFDCLRMLEPISQSFGFDHNIDCHECGLPVWLGYAHNQELADRAECFDCNFWLKRIRESGPTSVVINGVRYTIADEPPKGSARTFLGHGGGTFYIRFIDGRETDTVTTHNLWCQGNVPDRFRDRLPDNAVWEPRTHQ